MGWQSDAVPAAGSRHDLYNALRESLGEVNADTMMAYLPDVPQDEIATRSQVAQLASDVASLRGGLHAEMADLGKDLRAEMADLGKDLRSEIGDFRQESHGELSARVAELHGRFYRFFIAQIAALVALGTAIIFT